jgi:hypothetical protein
MVSLQDGHLWVVKLSLCAVEKRHVRSLASMVCAVTKDERLNVVS